MTNRCNSTYFFIVQQCLISSVVLVHITVRASGLYIDTCVCGRSCLRVEPISAAKWGMPHTLCVQVPEENPGRRETRRKLCKSSTGGSYLELVQGLQSSELLFSSDNGRIVCVQRSKNTSTFFQLCPPNLLQIWPHFFPKFGTKQSWKNHPTRGGRQISHRSADVLNPHSSMQKRENPSPSVCP